MNLRQIIYKTCFASAIVLALLVGMDFHGYASGIVQQAYNLIQDEGVSQGRGTTLNFTGAGVTCGPTTMLVTPCDIPGSSGLSGGVLRGTLASIPTCDGTKTNVEYWAVDAGHQGQCNGTSWFYRFGSIAEVVPTSTTDVPTWYNQTGASVTNVPGGVTLLGTASPGGTNIQGRLVALPATPYTAIACLVIGARDNANFPSAGLLLTDGTNAASSKAFTMGFQLQGTTVQYSGQYWNNATSFSNGAAGTVAKYWSNGPSCYGLSDDGANRKAGFSYDGKNWIVYITSTSTNFLTATHAGYYTNPNQSSSVVEIQVFSWRVANTALF